MEDFNEERIEELVLQGKKNQRTAQQMFNWCRNARLSRFGGTGIVEQITGVPIGLLGIECDHAPEGGMRCWNLKEAVVNFYLANCESCDQRSPGTGQGIEPLIQLYRKREKERSEEEQKQRAREARRQFEQLAKLECLRVPGDDLANQVVDSLVCIVQQNEVTSGTALVELACLAPETFSAEIVTFLKEQLENEDDKLEIPALRTLLQLPVDEETKQRIVVRNASKQIIDEHAAKYLKEHVHDLSRKDLAAILPNLALLARPITGFPHLERKADLEPILAIAMLRPEDTTHVLLSCLESRKPVLIDAALRAISVLTVSYANVVKPVLRDVLAKLLRRIHLLPGFGQDAGDDRLEVLRAAAVGLFRRFPEEADTILQLLLAGAGDTARSEAALVYSSVLEGEWNRPTVELGEAEEIAFSRILWMAVDDPFESMESNATRFFSHVHSDLLPIAAKHLDSILGAAAMLSSRLREQAPQQILAVERNDLGELDRTRRRNSAYLFQSNLVSWALRACHQDRAVGIQRVLSFYEALPEAEVELRANIVAHLSTLMSNSSAINITIPHLYKAMTSPEPIIRASAARTLGEISREVRRDLPDLVFEVNLVLLTDPNVLVHKTAVRSLKIYDFPERLKTTVVLSLITLIRVYQNSRDDQMFIVDLLRKVVHGCLTDTQLSGNQGAFVVSAISRLDDFYAHSALDSLGRSLVNAPGIVPLCIKTLGYGAEDYNRRDRELEILSEISVSVLETHASVIAECAVKFATTRPYITNSLVSLLAKAGCWKKATEVCTTVLANISNVRKERLLQYHYESLRQVCEFELSRDTEGISVREARRNWFSVQKQKEDEEAERNARQSFRPFLFE